MKETKKFKRVVEHDAFHLVISLILFLLLLLFFIILLLGNELIILHIMMFLYIPLLAWSIYDYVESREVYWVEIK